jgi:hypothetical protein
MQHLGEIAVVNPRLAVALLRYPKLPQVYGLSATFTSGAVGVEVSTQFDQPITSDFWVYDIAYQVQQPAAFTGSLLRAQQVYYNALNPDIEAEFQVTGGTGLPWVFASTPLPLEALAHPMTGPASQPKYGVCATWVMFWPQTLKATFSLTRAYAEQVLGVGEIPTVVTVAFSGLTLGCQNYGNLTIEQAQNVLRSEYSIDTPEIRGR